MSSQKVYQLYSFLCKISKGQIVTVIKKDQKLHVYSRIHDKLIIAITNHQFTQLGQAHQEYFLRNKVQHKKQF